MFYFTVGVVLVPAPVGYDSLGYLQQLSEQCLFDLGITTVMSSKRGPSFSKKNIPKPRYCHNFTP